MWVFLYRLCGVPDLKDFTIICFSNVLITSVPGAVFTRNALWALNSIYICFKKKLYDFSGKVIKNTSF